MSLNISEIQKIARLARIEITAAEEEHFAKTISTILDFVDTLNEVNTDGVEPTAQVTGLEDVVREDVVKKSTIKKELIAQMPQLSAGLLKVPAVFGDSEDVI